MDVGATGSRTDAGVPITWEVIAALPADTVLVRNTHGLYPDIVWFTRDAVVDGALRPLCHRCSHERADHAQHCRDAERALSDLEGERACARSAKLPAPEGARFLTCCAGYWKASVGGACPTCGALGAVLVPEVEVRDSADGSAMLHTTNVHAYHALDAAGFTRETARTIGDTTGHVFASRARLMAFEIRERLAAAGWQVKGSAKARRKTGGAA